MTDASHITLLPQLLAHVRAAAPGVRLEAARIDARHGAGAAGGRGRSRARPDPWLESGFYQQTLFPQDWVCLANSRHPRIGKTLGLRPYKAEAHIGIVSGTGHQLLEAALQAPRHRAPRAAGTARASSGLPAIVSTTDLIATLPRQIGETLARPSGLSVLRLPGADPDVHGQAALACALPPRPGQPLAARRLCGAVHARCCDQGGRLLKLE